MDWKIGVDIVDIRLHAARNSKSNIDFTRKLSCSKLYTMIASFVTYRIYAIYMFILYL